MAHFGTEMSTQRPSMRRKSSAQNLLSSFKPNPSVPPPLHISALPVANMSAIPFSASMTPTATTPLVRDSYDAQGSHMEGVTPGASSPQPVQGTSVEYLRDLVQKRIITLTYIRSIHEGRSHWFHTVLISQAELEKVFNNSAMKKRTNRFAILGLSLSTLLDINQPLDLLRGLLNTITEYDQGKDESDNKSSKMRIKFNKGKNPKKGVTGPAEYHPDSYGDASYLFIPSMPFPLDYHQTLLSLIDVLSEVYHKISKLLGPSPFPHASQHMIGPLGLLTPQPGVSYLFAGEQTSKVSNPTHGHSNANLSSPGTPTPAPMMMQEMDATSGSLWSIANASNAPQSVANMPNAASWTSPLGEMVLKIDGKLKRITSTLLKELDTVARNAVREELSSLDPLLRNINNPDDVSRAMYEFEGI